MRPGKWKKYLFLATIMILFCLTANSWATERFVISMYDDDNVGGSNKLYAGSFSGSSDCDGKALVFHRSGGWGGIEDTRIHMWGDGDIFFDELVAIFQDGFSRGAAFNISINGEYAEVCVSDVLRWVIATKLAKADLDEVLRNTGLSAAKLAGNIWRSARYGATGLSALVATGGAGAVVSVQGVVYFVTTAGVLVSAPLVTLYIENKLPDADNYIRDNLYLWYSNEPGYKSLCPDPYEGYIKYQVKPELINQTLDLVCRANDPSSKVERYRDWETCRLIANTSIDGKVWVYGSLCDPVEYDIEDAVDAFYQISDDGSGGSGSSDDEYEPGSGQVGDANLTINWTMIGYEGDPDASCVHELQRTMAPGEVVKIKLCTEIRNKGGTDVKNADLDYRIEDNRHFDDNDTKLHDEENIDIPADSTITDCMRNVYVTVSADGTSVRVNRDDKDRTFPVVDGVAKFYVFVDVEGGGDQDISSETDKAEYGKMEIRVRIPLTDAQKAAIMSILFD